MNAHAEQTRPRKSAAPVASWVAIVSLAAFLGLASLSAALHDQADQISDPAGDASPLIEIAATPANQSLLQEINDNTSMVDLRAGWIQYETAQDFHILVAVQDLPDGWGIPADAPAQNMTERQLNVVRIVANFSIADQEYQAVAVLHSPADGELVAAYELRSPGEEPVPLAGGFDTLNDVIRFRIPKDSAPADDGDRLSKFFVYSAYEDVIMDFAPDAEHAVDTGSEPELPGLGDLPDLEDPPEPGEILGIPEIPSTVTPNYGAEYVFGQYPAPTTGGGDGGGGGVTAADLTIAADRLQGGVAAGQMASYAITLTNSGGASAEAVLSLSSAPAGWAHELSGASGPLSVAPGESVDLQLIVSAADEAEGSLRSIVYMSTDAGQARSLSILTLLDVPADGGSGGGADGAGDAEGEDGGSSPGLPMVAAAAGMAAGLRWAGSRHRRR